MNNLQFFDLSSAMCDFIGVTQKNRSYMLEAIRAAAEKMCTNILKIRPEGNVNREMLSNK